MLTAEKKTQINKNSAKQISSIWLIRASKTKQTDFQGGGRGGGKESVQVCWVSFLLFFNTLLILVINSGKATAAARTALPSLTSACWIFSCFRNPPSSEMDYRISNVRTWSFLCLLQHTGVGHTDSESAQHFRLVTFVSCSWWDSNSGRAWNQWNWDRCSTNWATP